MSKPKAAPAETPLPSDWINGRVTYTLKDGHTVTFRPEMTAGEMAALILGIDFTDLQTANLLYGMREFAVYLLDWSLTIPMPDGSAVPMPLPVYEPGASVTVRAKQIEARLAVIQSLPLGRIGQIRKKLDPMKKAVAEQYEDEEPSAQSPTGDTGETGSTSEPASASA